MKQDSEIDNALREVAKQRDKLLREVPRLSPERRANVSDFLASEFPLEAALHEAAAKRDRFLNPPLDIPRPVELTLRRQSAATASDRPAGVVEWLRLFRLPKSVVLSACVLIAAAILCFGMWRNVSRPLAGEPLRSPPTNEVNIEQITLLKGYPTEQAEVVSRKISVRPFSLKTSEAASLQAFLAINNANLIGRRGLPIDVRLDRPMRVSLMEDEVETP